MKIDKIRSYNQILLAIGGTGAILFFLFIGLFILYDEISRRSYDAVEHEAGIISSEKTEELLQDSLRKQIVSFSNINLLDSANKIYLLPVRQANILKGETADDLLRMTNSFSGGKYFKKFYNNRDATFNNIVIYDSAINTSNIVFENRISISEYTVVKKEKATYVLIIGAEKDTNKDKYLNTKDLQELYVYEVEKGNLVKIPSREDCSVLSVDEQKKTKEIIGKTGLDRNKNGVFDIGAEPMILYEVDLVEKSLVEIVREDQINQLQKLLEGR